MAEWFDRRTWPSAAWQLSDLIAAKGSRTVSVVLPALNEQDTVAQVVRSVTGPLVDEVVVLDGGSTDRTAELALAAGAKVVDREQALPGVPVRPGKGEVLWRSLAASTGELVVFVDADLVDVEPGLVAGLLGPLLTVPGVELVKGFYRRPLRLESLEAETGGGRVTELVARPLIARFVPQAGGIVQPLGGEYAATRALLESVPFAGSYGVEIALLMDTIERHGLDAVAQVDLGVRRHRNRSLLDLGVMAQEVLETVLSRALPKNEHFLGSAEGSAAEGRCDSVELVQFVQTDGQWQPRPRLVSLSDRPPMCTVVGTQGVRAPEPARGNVQE